MSQVPNLVVQSPKSAVTRHWSSDVSYHCYQLGLSVVGCQLSVVSHQLSVIILFVTLGQTDIYKNNDKLLQITILYPGWSTVTFWLRPDYLCLVFHLPGDLQRIWTGSRSLWNYFFPPGIPPLGPAEPVLLPSLWTPPEVQCWSWLGPIMSSWFSNPQPPISLLFCHQRITHLSAAAYIWPLGTLEPGKSLSMIIIR